MKESKKSIQKKQVNKNSKPSFKIQLSDNIADVIEQYPQTTPIFLSYGLHCVGCFANVFDTIEAGCLIHGMDKEEQDMLLKDINLAILKNEKDKAKKKDSKRSSR